MATFSRQPSLPPGGSAAYDVLDDAEVEALHANAGRPYLGGGSGGSSSARTPADERRRRGRRLTPARLGTAGLALAAAALGLLTYRGLVQGDAYRHILAVMSPAAASAAAAPSLPPTHPTDRPARAGGAAHQINLPAGRTLRLQATAPPTALTRGSAVLNGIIVHQGDTVVGYRLAQVNPGWVVLQNGDRLVALRLTPNPSPAPKNRPLTGFSPNPR